MAFRSSGATPAVELRSIDKRFGGIHANRDVNLTVQAGTIHGIVGENGAGKTTLMSILYGFYRADRGEIRVRGRPVAIWETRDAIVAGIGMIHQHFMLVDTFTAIENIMLGAEGSAILSHGVRRIRRELGRLETHYGLAVPLEEPVGRLPIGLQQRVEILKSLYREADILILDEPTSVLTPGETDALFRILRGFGDRGKTVDLITHKLKEIMGVTDRVSVMRRGAVVAHRDTAETSPEELAELMVGRRVRARVEKGHRQPGRTLLQVERLTVRDDRDVVRTREVSLTVREGEIVGIAGVAGNGQSELLEALAGLRPVSAGQILLEGRSLGADGLERRLRGIAHVPEDREQSGLVLGFESCEFAVLGYLWESRYARKRLLDWPAIRKDTADRMEGFDVRPADPRRTTSDLSGGNQQKLVLAREFGRTPKLLLVGQPTRGVDVGAIEFIHRQLVTLREAGTAILMVSANLDEIVGLSDRVLVMSGGRIAGEVSADTATESNLGLLMAGVDTSSGHDHP